jgi:hypothetical protein
MNDGVRLTKWVKLPVYKFGSRFYFGRDPVWFRRSIPYYVTKSGQVIILRKDAKDNLFDLFW